MAGALMFSLGLGTPSALAAASWASGPTMPQQPPPAPLVLDPTASVSQLAQCLSVSSGALASGLVLISSEAGLTELAAVTAGGVGQPGAYGLVQRTMLPEFTRELQLAAPMAGAGTAELAGQQHEQLAALLGPGLAGMVASYAGTPAPVVLPSGLPMQTQDSVFSLCRDELGPRPSFQGITDPCDYSVAQYSRCMYDRKCDALRALEEAKRNVRNGWLSVLVVLAGAVAAPASLCLGLVVTIGGAVLGLSEIANARGRIEDARFSMDEINSCWKGFLFNNNCGVTP